MLNRLATHDQTAMLNRLASGVLIGGVRTYQYTLRPFIGAHCRHWPSCSEYAVEALKIHGPIHGSALTAWRILRCNPWNAGGPDPVPPAKP